MADSFKIKQETLMNHFSQLSELPLSQCFTYPDHVCLGYSLPLPLGAYRNKKEEF